MRIGLRFLVVVAALQLVGVGCNRKKEAPAPGAPVVGENRAKSGAAAEAAPAKPAEADEMGRGSAGLGYTTAPSQLAAGPSVEQQTGGTTAPGPASPVAGTDNLGALGPVGGARGGTEGDGTATRGRTGERGQTGTEAPATRDDTTREVPVEPRRELAHTIYLSNDDSMSLSSAQRIEYAIAKGLPVPRDRIRPHELLNYYAFETSPVSEGETFSVKAELSPGEEAHGAYTLSVAVRGRSVTREQRLPLVLTIVCDVSGSMREEGKMEYLKKGLLAMLEQLKSGDVVSLVAFNQTVETVLEGFRVGDGDLGRLRAAIEGLTPGGSTDLNLGLTTGYDLAVRLRDEEKNNRVLLITDALANTGTTDERLIANVGSHFDEQRIRLSGSGVGADFNDSLLDRLTERGKGAYVFLGSEAVIDRIFGEGFTSLVETIAVNVRFRLDLPVSLAMERFYGEEASTVREAVQAIHYFSGTTQVFLSDLKIGDREPEGGDEVKLTIEYDDPATLESREKTFSFKIEQILGDPSRNILKARLLMAWARHLGDISDHDHARDAREAAKADSECTEAESDLQTRARSLTGDADVSHVLELLDRYCERFEGAGPTRVNEFPARGER
jgi:Ca-activated chloride channel family protein